MILNEITVMVPIIKEGVLCAKPHSFDCLIISKFMLFAFLKFQLFQNNSLNLTKSKSILRIFSITTKHSLLKEKSSL